MAFYEDENLPTWLHTSLTMLIASLFALFLIWPGIQAIITQDLPPFYGPELGQLWFGNQTLKGYAAIWGGCLLILNGVSFLLVGLAFTKWAEKNRTKILILSVILVILSQLFFKWAIRKS